MNKVMKAYYYITISHHMEWDYSQKWVRAVCELWLASDWCPMAWGADCLINMSTKVYFLLMALPAWHPLVAVTQFRASAEPCTHCNCSQIQANQCLYCQCEHVHTGQHRGVWEWASASVWGSEGVRRVMGQGGSLSLSVIMKPRGENVCTDSKRLNQCQNQWKA